MGFSYAIISTRNCFKRDGDRPKLSATGFPQFKDRTLEAWLDSLARSLACLHAIPLIPPYPPLDRGRISIDPTDWGLWPRYHPLLRAWAELILASRLRQRFGRLEGTSIRPEYHLIPSFQSLSPDLNQLRHLVHYRIFRPAPGHAFLVGTLRDLDLRALAAVLDRRPGQQSELARLLRQGLDPHHHAASRLSWMVPDDFVALKARNPEVYDRWLRIARALLFAVPRGAGDHNLGEIAARDFLVKISAAESLDFHRRMVDEIYPELGAFLRDDAVSLLAARLGEDEQRLWRGLDLANTHPESTPLALRRVVLGSKVTKPSRNVMVERRSGKGMGPSVEPQGKRPPTLRRFVRGTKTRKPSRNYVEWDFRVWCTLQSLKTDTALAPLLSNWPLPSKNWGSRDLYKRLFHRDVVTSTGRARGQLGFAEARSYEYLSLADDAAKAASFAAVAAGFRLDGYSSYELAIEIPEEADDSGVRGEFERVVCEAAGGVLDSIPVICSVERRERW